MSTVMSTFVPECYAQPWLATDTAACVQDGDILIEPLVRAYVAGQAHVQVTVNPSGALWTGGLNEPKFHVDGSRFDDEWGRPQRCVLILYSTMQMDTMTDKPGTDLPYEPLHSYPMPTTYLTVRGLPTSNMSAITCTTRMRFGKKVA